MLFVGFGLLFVLNFVHSVKLVNTCGPDEFPCDDGSCVEKSKWCDTKEDCGDDSDENYCLLKSALRKNPNRCNQTKFFLCDDGQCIPAIGRCDGFSSCFDNSDEDNCDPEILSVSNTSIAESSKAERHSISLNGNDSKVFQNLNDRSSSMQADHVFHTEEETVNKSVDVSKGTNQGSRNLVLSDSRQPLEFRDISGGMLNISRNEQNSTKINNSETLNKMSTNKNSSSESKIKAGLEVSNNQNNSRHTISQHVHSKLPSSQDTVNKELNLYEGYIKLQTRDFRSSKEKVIQWLIKNRDRDYGWGDETARAVITLLMAGFSVEKSVDMTALMSKQLHLKLFTLMSRNETKRIPLGELALYINALSESCDNPRNFHGHDLINILRHRTNAVQETKFVTPLVYLVLCLNDELFIADVMKVRDMLYDTNMTKTDTEAVISLTATCISRMPKFSNIGIEQIATRKLYHKVIARGLPQNIYELSLLTQALNEAKINQNLWNRSEAMRRITGLQELDGSFGDILSTYYAVPTLCGKSFLSIGKNCPSKDEGLVPVEILKNGKDEKMYVHYSLRFGNPIEMSQSLMIKVQRNTSFMDIMRIAATLNPAYRFKYDEIEGKLSVYSIGGIANDAERGLYWVPYTSGNTTKLVPFEGDIRNFIPLLGEYITFWRKPVY